MCAHKNSVLAICLITILAFTSGLSADSQSRTNTSLRIWDFKYTDSKTRIAMDRVDKLFREEYPQISLEHRGFYDQEYIPALRTALLAGSGPDVLFLHFGIEFSELASYLETLDSFLGDLELKFRPESMEACIADDGCIKALPMTMQGIGWYYNKELFHKAGLDAENPPVEWDDFLDTCRILKERGIIPIAAGNNRPMTTEFLRRSLISAFFTDQEIADFYKQGRGVGSPRFRQIMEFCRTLSDKGFFHEEGLMRPYFNFASQTFSSGEAAMIPGLISDISHWKTFSDALGPEVVGYFPNLKHPEMARPGVQLLQDAGVLVCINKDSERKDDAFLYLQHLFGNKAGKIWMEDLGMLLPLEEIELPLEAYPVLREIKEALGTTGADPELYVPSVYTSDVQYRLDDLLINTREISVDEYLIKIFNELRLY